MLQLQILGNLTKDAERRQIGDNEFTAFTVAVSMGKQDTLFVRCLKRNADALAQYLNKGTKVFVQGQMTVSVYEGGEDARADVTLWANNIELCGTKKQEAEQDPFAL